MAGPYEPVGRRHAPKSRRRNRPCSRPMTKASLFSATSLASQFLKTPRSVPAKRWVVVAPSRGAGAALVLAVPSDERQRTRVGDQTGGRVGFFLHSDELLGRLRDFAERGVSFLETPRREPYGLVAVFVDPWGGKWDLLQPASGAPKCYEAWPVSLERQVLFWAIGAAALADRASARLSDNAFRRRHCSWLPSRPRCAQASKVGVRAALAHRFSFSSLSPWRL